jgi:hypothetical protein
MTTIFGNNYSNIAAAGETPIYQRTGGGGSGLNMTKVSGSIDKNTAARESAHQVSNGLWYNTLTDVMYLSDELYDLSYFDVNNPNLAKTTDIRVHATVKDIRPVGSLSYGSYSGGTYVFDVSIRISKHLTEASNGNPAFPKSLAAASIGRLGFVDAESDLSGPLYMNTWNSYAGGEFVGGAGKHTFFTAINQSTGQTAWHMLELYSLDSKLHVGMCATHNGAYDWTDDTMEYAVEISN